MIRKLLFAAVFIGPIISVAQPGALTTQPQPVKTGVTTRDFADSNRSNWLGTGPRPLRTVIWYPAAAGGVKETIDDPVQFPSPVLAYRNAEIAGNKRYPLVLISHGAQGNAQQMRWMAYYFASKGYIAVVVNHNGTNEEERKTGNLTLSDFCMWERPKDLSVVLDKMLKDPILGSSIDTTRIVAAGFSLGGTTVIWLAGSILNLDDLGKKSPPPPPQFLADINAHKQMARNDTIVKNSFLHAEESFRDRRFKAVFALAPAIGQGFDQKGLKDITIPVLIVVGDADIVNPLAENARHFAENIPSARKLIVLPGERGHYTKPPATNERPLELQQVSEVACQFFNEVLKLPI
ncbi:MAG TPA: prolyl oligopeptidase family serine peptidase [Puia sp.]|nr:prolyl oligopeptidase family serine peptidase [Puia sp.]